MGVGLGMRRGRTWDLGLYQVLSRSHTHSNLEHAQSEERSASCWDSTAEPQNVAPPHLIVRNSPQLCSGKHTRGQHAHEQIYLYCIIYVSVFFFFLNPRYNAQPPNSCSNFWALARFALPSPRASISQTPHPVLPCASLLGVCLLGAGH